MNNKEKILDLMSTILNKEITEDDTNSSVDTWDSMAQLEIIVTIEEEFGIKIPEDKIPEMTSIKKILEVIDSL